MTELEINPCSVELQPRLPLLITGLAGVAGFNAFHYFRQKFPGQVFGIRRKDLWSMTGDGIIAADVEDKDSLKRLFDEHQFGSVLNTGGSCALKHCELDYNMAYRVNVEGISNLLEQIKPTGTRLIHLSIDLVFSGTKGGGHREADETDPVTVYGKTMVLAEETVAREKPDAAILRISLPMGISYNGHAGAIDWIQNRFKFVFYDELDLAPGKLRMKVGGGAAGHNGIRSITAHIGADFRRARIGIGHPGAKSKVTGHVLGNFSKNDQEWLEPMLDAIAANAPFLAVDDQRFATALAQQLAPPRASKEASSKAQTSPSNEKPSTEKAEKGESERSGPFSALGRLLDKKR